MGDQEQAQEPPCVPQDSEQQPWLLPHIPEARSSETTKLSPHLAWHPQADGWQKHHH